MFIKSLGRVFSRQGHGSIERYAFTCSMLMRFVTVYSSPDKVNKTPSLELSGGSRLVGCSIARISGEEYM